MPLSSAVWSSHMVCVCSSVSNEQVSFFWDGSRLCDQWQIAFWKSLHFRFVQRFELCLKKFCGHYVWIKQNSLFSPGMPSFEVCYSHVVLRELEFRDVRFLRSWDAMILWFSQERVFFSSSDGKTNRRILLLRSLISKNWVTWLPAQNLLYCQS